MTKDFEKKNLEVFKEVISKIAMEAVSDIEGVELAQSKKNKSIVCEFLPSDRVDVTLSVIIDQVFQVPTISATIQEKVIASIEKVTKYRVHDCNIEIIGVNVIQ